MCKMSLIKKEYTYTLFAAIWHLSLFNVTHPSINFDDLLQTTSYAQLLKEVICMADAIGLLNHRIDDDELRFIEDSILGKMTRISRLLTHIKQEEYALVDLSYLTYWFDLAKCAPISPIILDEITLLEQKVQGQFQQG